MPNPGTQYFISFLLHSMTLSSLDKIVDIFLHPSHISKHSEYSYMNTTVDARLAA